MRTNIERTKIILERANELHRQRELKKNKRIEVGLCSGILAAGMCILFEICRSLPETAERIFHEQAVHLYGTAALLGSNDSIGYILTAIFAFMLGACVTLILYLIRRRVSMESSRQAVMTEDDEKKYREHK